MEYDTYRLYLGTDYDNFVKMIPCKTLEQVEYELNNAELYEKYLVIAFNNIKQCDDIIDRGRIEPNRSQSNKVKTRTRKKGR